MTAEIILESKTEKGHDFVPINSLWRISIEQYHAMIRAGAFTDDDPIELLQGWLVQKMPKNPRHSTITRILRKLLSRLDLQDWYIDSQEPLTTLDSEPEPDVMIVRGDEQDYFERHPGPEDLAIVVEVSDSTLNRDRTLKKQLYAAALVPVYWIVNVPDQQVEVYTQPSAELSEPDFQQRLTYKLMDSVPVVVEGEQIGAIVVSELFNSDK